MTKTKDVAVIDVRLPWSDEGSSINHAQVSLHHIAGRGIVMSCYPAERREDGILALHITSGSTFMLEPSKRFNRKNLEHWRECIDKHIREKHSIGWLNFRGFLKENNLPVID